jgi:hypothetical protein
MSKHLPNAVLTVVLAVTTAVFVLNLAANPQLFDLVLPVIIVAAVIIWLLPNWQQHQRQ